MKKQEEEAKILNDNTDFDFIIQTVDNEIKKVSDDIIKNVNTLSNNVYVKFNSKYFSWDVEKRIVKKYQDDGWIVKWYTSRHGNNYNTNIDLRPDADVLKSVEKLNV